MPGQHVFFSVALGLLGGYLGYKTRLPMGSLLGSILAVIAYRVLVSEEWVMPRGYSMICQALVGVLIASAYNADFLKRLSGLWVPMLTSCVSLICVGLILAVVFFKMGLMDFPTAYIATSPGAMNVLVAMSGELNADILLVASFHFTRILLVNLTAPLLFKIMTS